MVSKNYIQLLGALVPLHNSSSYGHFEVTELLVKHGANVNAKDLWAFTPIHEAASKNRVEVCSLLLSEKADPTLLNCHNKTAIDSAPTRDLQDRIACKSCNPLLTKTALSLIPHALFPTTV